MTDIIACNWPEASAEPCEGDAYCQGRHNYLRRPQPLTEPKSDEGGSKGGPADKIALAWPVGSWDPMMVGAV